MICYLHKYIGGGYLRKTAIADCLTAEMLREKLAQAESKEQFQRWQIIYVIKTKGFTPAEAADVVGVSTGTVHQWVHAYNKNGPDNYNLKGRGGRRSSYMTVEQESELLNEFANDAEKGLIITAWDVQKRIEKKTGMKVSDDFVYDLFNRNGWRKVVPKPRHPKSRKESQEEFKKNSQRLWMPPRKSSAKTTSGR
jgi:transposase